MNQPTGRNVVHPLAAQYLAELDGLLVGIDPAVRADTLAGVHEHLDVATGGVQDDARVREALAQLGSPYDVAAEAHGDRIAPPAPVPFSSKGWLPVVVGILLGLALLLVLAVAGSAASVVTTSSTSSSGPVMREGAVVPDQPDQVQVESTQVEFTGTLGGTFVGLFASLPFWVAAFILIGVSALWRQREKVILFAIVPAVALTFGALPEIGWALIGEKGVYGGAWIGIALAIAGVVLVVRLCRRASHRSRDLRS